MKSILFVDPGHGMSNKKYGRFDSGAVNFKTKVRECDVALSYALTIKHVFAEAGVKILLSRDDNNDHTYVGDRAGRAEAAGATHFLSLHCDSFPLARGTSTFYRNSPLWADEVHKAALSALGLKNRGLRTEGQSQHSKLAVLSFKGKAALLEIGFISSNADLEIMLKRESRIQFAENLLSVMRKQG